MNHSDTELSILETIYNAEKGAEPLTQRGLARSSGLSLGMTNLLVRRLAERGWVKLTRLSARSVRYALTPEGVGTIARRTADYFRRAERDAYLYRERLEAYILAEKRNGAETIVLAGPSKVDFLLEYYCEIHGLVFVKTADFERAIMLGKRPRVHLLLSEQCADDVPGMGIVAGRLAELLAVSASSRYSYTEHDR